MLRKPVDLKEYYRRRGLQTPEKPLERVLPQAHFQENKTVSRKNKDRNQSLLNLKDEDKQKILCLMQKLEEEVVKNKELENSLRNKEGKFESRLRHLSKEKELLSEQNQKLEQNYRKNLQVLKKIQERQNSSPEKPSKNIQMGSFTIVNQEKKAEKLQSPARNDFEKTKKTRRLLEKEEGEKN